MRGFPAERRKRGEAAEESDDEADAPLGREIEVQQCVFTNSSDQKAPDQVDDQRARGKRGQGARLHETLEGVARQGAERSEYKQQENAHEYSLYWGIGSPP